MDKISSKQKGNMCFNEKLEEIVNDVYDIYQPLLYRFALIILRTKIIINILKEKSKYIKISIKIKSINDVHKSIYLLF